MSRSYRKPYHTQGYGGVWRKHAKKGAARRVRTSTDVADGAAYKRTYNSWGICDWYFIGDPKDWKVSRK